MFYQLRERWHRFRFAQAAAGISSTPPLRPQPCGVVIISSVSHLDLMMYLVAIKSFYKYLGRGQIVILNDGTLTPGDLALLDEHVAPKKVLMLDDVPYGGGEKGVRWGIMLAIADLSPEAFVIQLDSDTLTRGPMPEVERCISDRCSFTLGTEERFDVAPISEICKMMNGQPSQHVQKVAEGNFDRLPNYPNQRYVRGNSGLAGFALGSVVRDDVEQFFADMTEAIGKKWRERGSFQVSSNFFVANSPNAQVLPLGRYTNVAPSRTLDESVFLHFIGRYRFASRDYWHGAQRAVARLLENSALIGGAAS